MRRAALIMSIPATILVVLMTFPRPAATRPDQTNPRELGTVSWQTDLAAALENARRQGLPVFLLFQEVPGCGTCQRFGDAVLSDPLLVEAIETCFVPVAIHNNRSGRDAEVLERYREPAWNNPVVRFLDAGGVDLIPRKGGVYSPHAIGSRMVAALEAAGRPVPRYLAELIGEIGPQPTRQATFVMGCYWSGEAKLGALDGVVATAAGWLDGREVVVVEYRPEQVSHEELARLAAALGCRLTDAESRPRPAKASDRKYYLARSPLRFLPLTPQQASRVNAALASGGDPALWLSPRQQELARKVAERLAEDDDLDGLERPDTLAGRAAYQQELLNRLAAGSQ